MSHLARLRLLPTVAVLLTLGCGGDGGTDPDIPRPTTITLSPTSLSFTFLGQTLTLQASVTDQNGAPINTTVSWSSSAPQVASVNTSGVVTATGNGTAQITALAGSASASAAVTVQQVASQLVAAAGDGQTGTVGQALPEALVAQLNDEGGSPVPGIGITFSLLSGGGSLTVTSATTGQDGRVTTTWTLGTGTADTQQAAASISDNASIAAIFTATPQADAPTTMVAASGDGQTTFRGLTLAEPVVVLLSDQHGNPVPGQSVTFAVTQGGGSVDLAVATTAADGTASATWTLGVTAGPNALTASAAGLSDVNFTATALGFPDLSLTNLTLSPMVALTDQPLQIGATVSNSGDGGTPGQVSVELLIDGVSIRTVVVGILAAGGSATAGFQAGLLSEGPHTIKIVVDPANEIPEDDEDNNTLDGAVTAVTTSPLTDGVAVPGLGGGAGSQTYFTFDVPLPTPSGPSARLVDQTTLTVTLSGGAGNADFFMRFGEPPTTTEFNCASQGATSTETCVITDPAFGTWYILVIGAAEFSGVSLLGELGTVQGPPGFDIQLSYLTPISAGKVAAFEAAKSRWASIVRGELPDFDFGPSPLQAGACADQQLEVNDVVDDLRIYVVVTAIDGPGGTLGQAGPCVLRPVSELPILGVMQFDVADLNNLEASGALSAVILHEMAHVLGIGSLWQRLGLVVNLSLPASPGADTHFTGARAIVAFDAAGGVAYTGGEKVPVENELGPGSGDVHFRESVLINELMTPILNFGQNPLSAISAESLGDMGYVVDSSQASPYTLTLLAAAKVAPSQTLIMMNDVRDGPIYVVDENGRIVPIVRR